MTQFPEEQYKELNNEVAAENKGQEPLSTGDLFSVLPGEEKTLPEEEPDMMKTLPGEEPEEEKNTEPLSILPEPPSAPSPEKNIPVVPPEPVLIPEQPAVKILPEENTEKPLAAVLASEKKNMKKSVSLTHLTGKTLGQLLAAARAEQAMTVEDVTEQTLIRADYIRALEEDEHKKLPPVIFVKAYVRALRDLYGIDEASFKMLQDHLADLEPAADVPEKVVDELNKNVQINEEEARKVRLTGYYLMGGLAALLILIVALVIYFAAVRGRNVQKDNEPAAIENVRTEQSKFDPEGISSLIPQIIPEEQLLPLPAKKRSRR